MPLSWWAVGPPDEDFILYRSTWLPGDGDVFVLPHPIEKDVCRVTFTPTVASVEDGKELAQLLADTTIKFLLARYVKPVDNGTRKA